MRGAVTAGLRVLSNVCTASNSAASMIGGTAISTTSASGLRSRVFQYLDLFFGGSRMVNKLRLLKGGSVPTFLVLDRCCTTSLPWTLE